MSHAELSTSNSMRDIQIHFTDHFKVNSMISIQNCSKPIFGFIECISLTRNLENESFGDNKNNMIVSLLVK